MRFLTPWLWQSSGPHRSVELDRLDSLVSKSGKRRGQAAGAGQDMRVEDLAALFAKHNCTTSSRRSTWSRSRARTHCTRFMDRPPLPPPWRRDGEGDGASVDLSLYTCTTRPHGDVAAGRQRDYAVDVDPVTPTAFDNGKPRRRDGPLYSDEASRSTVEDFAKNQRRFFEAFEDAMVKLGRVGVKIGCRGEIRRDCTVQCWNLELLQLQSSHTSRTS
nr:unnamed protein product [Digitaria exilis]